MTYLTGIDKHNVNCAIREKEEDIKYNKKMRAMNTFLTISGGVLSLGSAIGIYFLAKSTGSDEAATSSLVDTVSQYVGFMPPLLGGLAMLYLGGRGIKGHSRQISKLERDIEKLENK